jgi:hypothetical protein
VSDPGFTVWVTGADSRALHAVADEVASRLAARHLAVETLDERMPGFEALAGDGLEHRVTFVAGLLARHGVAVVVALPGTRAGRDGARARLGRFIEVHARAATGAPASAYQAPDRAEVDVGGAGAGVEHVILTLEVLELLRRDAEPGYSPDEEREVIRRLKSFGYL